MTSGSFLKGLVQIWWCLKEEEIFSTPLEMIPGSPTLTTSWSRYDYTSIIVLQQCNACIMVTQVRARRSVAEGRWSEVVPLGYFCVCNYTKFHVATRIVPCTGCKNTEGPLALYE